MSLQVATHQTEGYQITTEMFEGPLDLLLELIERAELDITRLALAQVTDQYLEYMRALQERNAAEVSAFLVIAARLVQIKSAALLPRPSVSAQQTEEEDPGEALARQLILYKRFKELSGWLANREEEKLRTYLRIAPPPKSQGRLDLEGVSLKDLMQAAWEIFSVTEKEPLSKVVSMPRITIRDRIQTILKSIREVGKISFQSVLSGEKNRVEIVVSFLAMLELIKRRIVVARQDDIFGDIQIEAIGEVQEQMIGDLEFDE